MRVNLRMVDTSESATRNNVAFDYCYTKWDKLQNNNNKGFIVDLRHAGLEYYVMDEFNVATLMIYANIELSCLRKIIQVLTFFMGIENMCVFEPR